MSEKDSLAFPQTYRITQHDIGVFSEEPIAKGGLTSLEYAAIHLRVEHPDISPWLNEMIRKSRRDEFAKAAMWEALDETEALKFSDAFIDILLKEDGK